MIEIKKEGFVFMEILLGIFLLGLIVVVYLPILLSNLSNFSHIKNTSEINYIGEMVFERLKSKDEYSIGLLMELDNSGELDFRDLSNEENEGFQCKVINLDSNDFLWEFKIKVTGKDGSNVEFKGSVPKE